jgi:hypothetical protein
MQLHPLPQSPADSMKWGGAAGHDGMKFGGRSAIIFASAMIAIHTKHNHNISNSSSNAAFRNTPQQSHEFCVCSTGRSSRHLPSRSTTRGDTVGTNAAASEHTREGDGVSPAAPKVEILPRAISLVTRHTSRSFCSCFISRPLSNRFYLVTFDSHFLTCDV